MYDYDSLFRMLGSYGPSSSIWVQLHGCLVSYGDMKVDPSLAQFF